MFFNPICENHILAKTSEFTVVIAYDQEISQSQNAGKRVASLGRATQKSQDTMKTNKVKQPALSSPSR